MSATQSLRVSLVCLAFVATAIAADSVKRGFVRERGTYALDDSRGALEFLTATNGRLSWSLSWRHEGSKVSLSMPDEGFFRGPGWFVFIESSSRVWLFDGESQLELVHRTERGISRNSIVAVFDSCPKEVKRKTSTKGSAGNP